MTIRNIVGIEFKQKKDEGNKSNKKMKCGHCGYIVEEKEQIDFCRI